MTVNKVWIITDDQNSIEELCGGGRQLGDHVTIVLFGDRDQAEKAVAFGADRVYLYKNPEQSMMLEAYATSIVKLLSDDPANLVIVNGSIKGKLLAGKIATQLGTSAVSNVSEFSLEDGKIVVKHMVYGGAAVRTEELLSETAVVTTGSGVFTALSKDETRSGEIVEMDSEAKMEGIKVLETQPKQGEVVHLGAAKRVIGVGRGFGSQEDLKMAEDLATLVDAEMACSRPIAEGEKWMSKERYVGVSGVVLKPDIYVAIGISGQIQHMVGVNQAKTLVAINKDKNAPIFKQVDIGLVGDIYKVLPQIVEKLKS